jgi:hypothetical protein
MSIRLFTEEQMDRLREHPYVQEVTEQFVYFSVEFKERFYNEFMSGKKPRKIIIGMGLDPELLGQSRINGIKQYVLRYAKRDKGFTDIHTSSEIHLPVRQTPEEKIRRLEHQLAYTKQELEFVKKIVLANREAQKEWKSKRRQE